MPWPQKQHACSQKKLEFENELYWYGRSAIAMEGKWAKLKGQNYDYNNCLISASDPELQFTMTSPE